MGSRQKECVTKESKLALHFLKRLDELIEIFRVKHDRRLLPTTGLLGYLEEHPTPRLLEIDIERPLACMNRDGMDVRSKGAPGRMTRSCHIRRYVVIMTG